MKESWTIWFTGMHGAGKSTIAAGLAERLRKVNVPVVIVDGDEIRKTVSSDLGYTAAERNEHMKRVAGICKIISENGVIVIASVASPTESSREHAKSVLKKMLLVYIKCPLEICRKRDVKGHYKKAQGKAKGFEDFLGMSSKYEEPKNPDLTLNTDKESIKESVGKLFKEIKSKNIL